MSDEHSPDPPARPRPRYGEYATPQEQAAIIARSMPPVSPVLIPPPAGSATGAESVKRPADSDIARAAPAASSDWAPPSSPPAVTARRRTWDVVLSIALLTWGLVNVLTGFAQYSDLPALIDQVYATQSIGDFTATPLASTVGTIIVVANVVLWALPTWITVRRLIAGRLAFWVPLIAAVVAIAVAFIGIGILMVGDPAFQQYAAGIG